MSLLDDDLETNVDFTVLSDKILKYVRKHCIHFLVRELNVVCMHQKKGIINADVNGSFNILRKEVGDGVIPTDIGFVFNPRRINLF